jgi:hypothetical protein
MPATILSDNGASSGTAGLKTSGSNDGILELQTTTGGGTATAAITIDTAQRSKFPTTIGVGGATPATSGSGITFPATASASSDANTLDDYEEGTWIPSDASGASLSITFNNASYTKIGRLVYIRCSTIVYPSTANTSIATIGNLPFTNTSGNVGGGALVTADAQAQRMLIAGSTIFIYPNATDSSATNADLSGATIYGLCAVYSI